MRRKWLSLLPPGYIPVNDNLYSPYWLQILFGRIEKKHKKRDISDKMINIFYCHIFWQVESKTLSPKWMEQFDLKIYEDQSSILELSVWDKDVGKDDIMGRLGI